MNRRQMIKATLAAIAGAALPAPEVGQVGEVIVFRRAGSFSMPYRGGKSVMMRNAIFIHGHPYFPMPERRQ